MPIPPTGRQGKDQVITGVSPHRPHIIDLDVTVLEHVTLAPASEEPRASARAAVPPRRNRPPNTKAQGCRHPSPRAPEQAREVRWRASDGHPPSKLGGSLTPRERPCAVVPTDSQTIVKFSKLCVTVYLQPSPSGASRANWFVRASARPTRASKARPCHPDCSSSLPVGSGVLCCTAGLSAANGVSSLKAVSAPRAAPASRLWNGRG